MSESSSSVPLGEQLFTPQYWGELQPFDPAATVSPHKEKLSSGSLELGNLLRAWSSLMDGTLDVANVPAGERFDPFNLELSTKLFYQFPGTVLLVDVERLHPPNGPHYDNKRVESLGLSAFDLIQPANKSGVRTAAILNVPAIVFSDPSISSLKYERTLNILLMVETKNGASIPWRCHKTRGYGHGQVVSAKPDANLLSQGLPLIGQTYVAYNQEGKPEDIKRLRSLDVLTSGSYGGTKVKDQVKASIGKIASKFLPIPNPGHS